MGSAAQFCEIKTRAREQTLENSIKRQRESPTFEHKSRVRNRLASLPLDQELQKETRIEEVEGANNAFAAPIKLLVQVSLSQCLQCDLCNIGRHHTERKLLLAIDRESIDALSELLRIRIQDEK